MKKYSELCLRLLRSWRARRRARCDVDLSVFWQVDNEYTQAYGVSTILPSAQAGDVILAGVIARERNEPLKGVQVQYACAHAHGVRDNGAQGVTQR